MPAIMTLQGPNLALLGASSGQGYFPPGMVYGVKLRPVPCDPANIDPEQLRIGTLVEMEHTRDPATARQIALHHLCETFPHPYYIRGAGVRSERLLLNGPVFDAVKAHPWLTLLGLFAVGYAASRVLPEWGDAWGSHQAAHKRETAFHGPRRRRRR